MCNQCYLKMVNNNRKGQRNTRGRRNQMKSKDDNIKQNIQGTSSVNCNAANHHSHNLNQFGDSLYFTSAYKQKISNNNLDDRKNKKHVPFLCSKRQYQLTDK